jgi:hypothetical protein
MRRAEREPSGSREEMDSGEEVSEAMGERGRAGTLEGALSGEPW